MSDCADALVVTVVEDDPPVVVISGQADFYARDRISEVFDALLSNGTTAIKADLRGLRYIDSSALSALIKSAVRASRAGGRIELVGASERVSRMLTLCGAAVFFLSSTPAVPVCRDDAAPEADFWQVSSFSIPAAPEAISTARERLEVMVRNLPLSSRDAQDILVAVGEALSNAIRHGCPCDPSRKLSVKCVAGASRLAIDVTESGVGLDPVEANRSLSSSPVEGGMGMYLIYTCMDEVSFSFDGATTVRLVKYLNGLAPREPGVEKLSPRIK